MINRFAALAAVSMLAVGCAGGDESGSSEASEAPAAAPAVVQASGLNGEELFQEKTCNVCHAFGSRMVGPDLAGVTERREKDWVLAMMLSTDSMLQNDSAAIALFDEYGTPMLTPSMTAGEADAIYEYLVGK